MQWRTNNSYIMNSTKDIARSSVSSAFVYIHALFIFGDDNVKSCVNTFENKLKVELQLNPPTMTSFSRAVYTRTLVAHFDKAPSYTSNLNIAKGGNANSLFCMTKKF